MKILTVYFGYKRISWVEECIGCFDAHLRKMSTSLIVSVVNIMRDEKNINKLTKWKYHESIGFSFRLFKFLICEILLLGLLSGILTVLHLFI